MSQLRLKFLALIALCTSTTLSAQAPKTTKPDAQGPSAASRDSVIRSVQAFYDWYLPRFKKPGKQDVMMLAATHGPLPFDTTLVHWLRIDSTARARNTDEIDGLDGDPYLNSQDPCNVYKASAARPRGADLLVYVDGSGGCAAHKGPDVKVVMGVRAGRWTVLEFIGDPDGKGLIPLLKTLHPKAK